MGGMVSESQVNSLSYLWQKLNVFLSLSGDTSQSVGRMANRADPDQIAHFKAVWLDLHCLLKDVYLII